MTVKFKFLSLSLATKDNSQATLSLNFLLTIVFFFFEVIEAALVIRMISVAFCCRFMSGMESVCIIFKNCNY